MFPASRTCRIRTNGGTATFKIVDLYKIAVGISLGVIAAILTTSIVASLLRGQRLPKLEEPA